MAQRAQTHRSRSYKWILFLFATAVTMIDFGLVFSFGAMFVTMMETLETDRATTATVQSILIGVTLGFGAVSGAIISKVGLPITTFVAGLMVPLGLCTSFFAKKIVVIYFTIGLVSGIGVSLTYISYVVAIERILLIVARLIAVASVVFCTLTPFGSPLSLKYIITLSLSLTIFPSLPSYCRNKSYKWILFLAATLVTMIDFGLVFSFGAMFVTMMETFETDRATTATVQSILIGVTLAFGAFSGVIISKVGLPITTFVAGLMVPSGLCISFFAKKIVVIYFTIGLVSGIGVSLTYISSVAAIGREFSGSQRTLCLAILNTSHIVASIAYPYFLEWLTERYGLAGTFLILGGVTLNTLVFSAVCFINRDKSKRNISSACKDDENDNEVQFEKTKTFRYIILNAFIKSKKYISKPYIFILVATGILLSSLDGYLAVMLDIALWKRINSSGALFSFVIYSISSAVSCLVPGLLKQLKGINSCIYPIFSSVVGGIVLLIVYVANDRVTYMVGTSLIGAAFGGIVSSSMNVVVKIVKSDFVPVATGLVLTAEGLLAIGFGPLFGWIMDTTGSYGSVLITIMTIHGVSAALYTCALLFRRWENPPVKPPEMLIYIPESSESPVPNVI